MKDQAIEATVTSLANKATGAGAGLALYGGWAASDIAAIGGLLIAVIGFCVTVYYKRKADRRDAAQEARETEEHSLRMDVLRRGRDE